jgi:hypothetical protein
MLTLRAPALHAPGAALVLALLASVSLAQTGEADPPGANTLPEAGEEPVQPKPIPTLEQKRQLLEFCNKAVNRGNPSCKGVPTTLSDALGEVPES